MPFHCTAYYLKRSEYECIAYHMSVVRCTTNQQPVRTCTSGNGLEVLILGKLLRTETEQVYATNQLRTAAQVSAGKTQVMPYYERA